MSHTTRTNIINRLLDIRLTSTDPERQRAAKALLYPLMYGAGLPVASLAAKKARELWRNRDKS